MTHLIRPLIIAVMAATLATAGCTSSKQDDTSAKLQFAANEPPLYPNETPELRAKINKWADHYEVPRSLVHRVVIRESTHRPWARNGPYYGLMQILPATARGMGYGGNAEGLLDADTNLEYAVKYLRGAWLVSDGNPSEAVGWYAKGYYYEAKRLDMLEETGLR
ncbi:transglycosylase SLT domain-containing protein [Marinibacterium sp. SX1]|uniref:transglycosylase SLT domain-containing protein n=1 Tax=Marinibacterium sp. SX1 TaxID=3388424 RepID=UPI003D181BA8